MKSLFYEVSVITAEYFIGNTHVLQCPNGPYDWLKVVVFS